MLEKAKLILSKALKRYGILDKKEEGEIDYYLISHVETPIVMWIVKIILSSIPIMLALLCYMGLNPYIPQMSIGISIAWYLLVEFISDIKRCR